MVVWDALPGRELVAKGLRDLEDGAHTDEALLVSIGAPRLTTLGIPVPDPVEDADHLLWAQLAKDDPDSAHSRYNALVRRLVSFERALARQQSSGGVAASFTR